LRHRLRIEKADELSLTASSESTLFLCFFAENVEVKERSGGIRKILAARSGSDLGKGRSHFTVCLEDSSSPI
jgi:hypothetical protein